MFFARTLCNSITLARAAGSFTSTKLFASSVLYAEAINSWLWAILDFDRRGWDMGSGRGRTRPWRVPEVVIIVAVFHPTYHTYPVNKDLTFLIFHATNLPRGNQGGQNPIPVRQQYRLVAARCAGMHACTCMHGLSYIAPPPCPWGACNNDIMYMHEYTAARVELG